MNNLMFVIKITFSQDINIWEFLYAAIGAFLGFGLTVLIENTNDKKKTKKLKNTILKNLTDELREIHDYLSNNTEDDPCIEIPCYNATIQSGNILIFVDEPYYHDMLEAYFIINQFITNEADIRNDNDRLKKSIDSFLSKIPLNY